MSDPLIMTFVFMQTEACAALVYWCKWCMYHYCFIEYTYKGKRDKKNQRSGFGRRTTPSNHPNLNTPV